MTRYIDFKTLPIFKDIKKIVDEAPKLTEFRYKCKIHTIKHDIPIYKIISFDTIRNYINNISDEIHIMLYIKNRDYLRDIYPYADNLELTFEIEEIAISRYGDEIVIDRYKERFKAILKDKENINVINAKAEKYDDSELDKSGFVEVRFQLLNRSFEPLRVKLVDGVVTKVTPQDIIENIIKSESQKILVDGKPCLDKIDITEPNNKEKQYNVIMPSGTHVIDIPDLVQNQYCGVYSSCLGSYIQYYEDKQTWFVYPIYDYEQFDKTDKKKIIFYNTDKQMLPASEITYREEGKTIYIMITGKVKYHSDLESEYMNNGVGFKAPGAKSFMRKPVELTADKVLGNRERLNHEIIQKDRLDGLNYAPRSKVYITSNPFREYSNIARKSVAQITLEWNHARYDMIYPGMPCKYNFINNGKQQTIKGIIVHTHTLITLKGSPSTSNTYTTNTSIVIALEKPMEILKGEEEDQDA